MHYTCYDKNGNYLGVAYTKTAANEIITNANIKIMQKEGVSPIIIAQYATTQKAKRENEYKKQSNGFAIFIGIIVFVILLNIIAGMI